MKIEIQDKDFWIQQCSLAIKNIQEERQRKQKEWEDSSWWHRVTTDEPMGGDFRWNWSGEYEPRKLKQLLELPCCGILEINPYEIDLSYILSWSDKTKENKGETNENE